MAPINHNPSIHIARSAPPGPMPLGLATDISKLDRGLHSGLVIVEASLSPSPEEARLELVTDKLPQGETFEMSLLGRAEGRAG